MCNFFSFSSFGGRFFYFTIDDILKIKDKGNPKNLNFDSHASIAEFYHFKEDKSNKFEFNPYSGILRLWT